ncbi:MAG: hypothetical protein SPL78_07365 [Bacteroidales bacterium]|nr:hypothetical protein [Muribaculaceae bacterium]MDY6293901.1 hypothetical protein [Bacteroidales bacterium]
MKFYQIPIICVLLCMMSSHSLWSQHLTYNDFMRVSKIKNWSDINDGLLEKGYAYGGSKSDTLKTMATWHRNCDDFRIKYDWNTEWDFETGSIYSVLLIYNYQYIVLEDFINNDYKYYEYFLNSKSSFNNFKSAAKQNGFKFLRDDIDDNNISSIYVRNRQKTKEVISFVSRRTGGYIVKYWSPYKTSM